MQFEKLQHKALAFIIVVCVLAKIVSLILLPQEAYNDALFHIFTAKQIIAAQTFDLTTIGVPPPFYYASLGTLFLLSGLPIDVVFAKVFGLAMLFLQLSLAFVVLKKIFQENFLPALAFFVAFPWVTRFTSTAYPESMTIVFVLAGIFLMLKLNEKKETSFADVLPLSFVIGAMSLSKLNGTILVPAFVLSTIFLLYKKTFKKTIVAFIILTLFLSSFWFALNYIKFGQFDRHLEQDISDFGAETGFSIQSIAQNLPFYYLYFWDFPNQSAFGAGSFLQGIDFWQAAVFFSIITVPLFAMLFTGTRKVFLQKNYLSVLLLFGIFLAFIPVVQRIAYYRLIIPAVPFFAILTGYGFEQLKEKVKPIAVIALVLFGLFSAAYTTGSAYYYNLDMQKNQELYKQISALTDNSVILIEANRARDIEFRLGKKAIGVSVEFTPEFLEKDPQKLFDTISKKGITHIAVVCRKDPFDRVVLQQMVGFNLLEEVFEKDCSKLFEVK